MGNSVNNIIGYGRILGLTYLKVAIDKKNGTKWLVLKMRPCSSAWIEWHPPKVKVRRSNRLRDAIIDYHHAYQPN